ncbi:hypothetical protein P170DRAFT_474313 [Aspergillus steynii IBT 23096]|uniref:Uncharacterized protein n=1 Tax=Aspergillus steynii IBT 23096 TaxID=1392250 RepID=A0A2I2GD50_9EURO|nr:uncharacterized protein P170DRAFT_474313 [Aspergillus steynii IBT 23096]PLB50757.1 hypothetical protein P170DRAFT_474313 [Aspergillus steynii IBT 23096]
MPKETPITTTQARLQNDYGADLWVKKQAPHRHPTAGRGLFAGLQDVKQYNVDSGWAKRGNEDSAGLFGFLYNRIFGGGYRRPE